VNRDLLDPLVVLTRPLPGGNVEVACPGVGIWEDPPKEAVLLEENAAVGTLRCRSRRRLLVLPADVRGRVLEPPRSLRKVPLEYGERMFTLSGAEFPAETAPESVGRNRSDRGGMAAGREVPPDGILAVRAPTDGVYYGRPSPGAAPFVLPGSRIRIGTTLGLVEVMKTFNPILYGGPDLPEEAEVVEIRVEDGGEIHAGDILLTVRP